MFAKIGALLLMMAGSYAILLAGPRDDDASVAKSGENPIDSYMDASFPRKRADTARVDDLTFLRRIWLDITGRLPEADAAREFFEDGQPGRRNRAIDRALASEAYVNRWTTFFGNLLTIRPIIIESVPFRNPMYQTTRDMVAANTPWDEMARAFLTDSGQGKRSDSLFLFWAMEGLEEDYRLDFLDDQVDYITGAMLGIRTGCISCHDGAGHLEQVNKGLAVSRREEFWGMAAFLSSTYFQVPTSVGDNLDRIINEIRLVDVDDPQFSNSGSFLIDGQGANLGEYVAQSQVGEGMRVPRNGSIVPPRYLFTGEAPAPGETRRAALARMITSDRQFARNMVNRVWAHFFGAGFVEPLDDWDLGRLNAEIAESNQATVQARDPELMELVTDLFIQSGYDLKALIALICNSALYQLDYAHLPEPGGNPMLSYWESNSRVRRLEAEALVDATFQVMGIPRKYTVRGYLHKTYASAWELPDTTEPGIDAIYTEDGRIRPNILQRLGYQGLDDYFYMQFSAHYLLDLFGRPNHIDLVERDNESNLPAALTFFNEPSIHYFLFAELISPNALAVIQALNTGEKTPEEMTRDLFYSILFRAPTNEEMGIFVSYLREGSYEESVPDIFWAILNHPDFLYK